MDSPASTLLKKPASGVLAALKVSTYQVGTEQLRLLGVGG